MATQPKKYKLVYPFDIKEMKKQIVDKEFMERDCGFCFHGSAAMSYIERRDIRTFKELTTEERNAYFTKAFFVVFVMYSITTAAVIITVKYFCMNDTVYKNYRFIIFVVRNVNFFVVMSFACSFLLSCFMIFIEIVQRKPFNTVMLLLELLFKSILVCAVAVKYKTHIMTVYPITFTILSLVCVGLGHTQFDFEQVYHLAILGSIEVVISFCVAVVMFSLVCNTLDIALVGVAMAYCFFSYMILIVEMLIITHGITIELTNHEYLVGAYLLYQPLVNVFMIFLRIFNMYFNKIEVPNLPKVPTNVPQSKRIYVWNFR